MRSILSFYLILVFTSLFAQDNPSNCSEAFQICNLGDYYFSHTEGFGIPEDLNIEQSEIVETNSTWLKFAADKSGSLEFVIVPEDQEDDIDFILYEGDECDDREAVRIMTSGMNIGEPNIFDCLGQTGLRIHSDDLTEAMGCFHQSDNFLKPIVLEEGKQYYLLVNNFNSNKGFTILFSGEESLRLVDHCKQNLPSSIDFEVFPNPAVDEITIRAVTGFTNPVEVIMFDMTGRVFKRVNYESISEESTLDISNIPSGEYYLRIASKEHSGLKSIIKI